MFGQWRAFSLDEGRNDYGERHGVTYFKPKGWAKIRILVDPQRWEEIKDWPILYHGTKLEAAAQIVYTGLRRPGDGGVGKAHGQAGSKTKKSLYLTPALGVASFPVYSTFFELEKDQLWGDLTVFRCFQRPSTCSL